MEEENGSQTGIIRTLLFTEEFEEFYNGLDDKEQLKHEQAIEVLQSIYVLNAKFVKKLVNTNLYEMRVSVGFNEYRTILFATDNANIIQAKEIFLLNGFLKKSSKDYEKQIKQAEKILKKLEL
jgi:hypothetical protein